MEMLLLILIDARIVALDALVSDSRKVCVGDLLLLFVVASMLPNCIFVTKKKPPNVTEKILLKHLHLTYLKTISQCSIMQ